MPSSATSAGSPQATSSSSWSDATARDATSLAEQVRHALRDGDRAEVRVGARDRRHDRGVGDDEPVDAEHGAARIDHRPDRARARGVEDPASLPAQVGRATPSRRRAGAPCPRPPRRRGGASDGRRSPAASRRALGEEAVVDDRRLSRVGRSQRHRATGVGLQEVDDRRRPPAVVARRATAGRGGPSRPSRQESLRPRTTTETLNTGPRRDVRRRDVPFDPDAGVIREARADRELLDDTDAEGAPGRRSARLRCGAASREIRRRPLRRRPARRSARRDPSRPRARDRPRSSRDRRGSRRGS